MAISWKSLTHEQMDYPEITPEEVWKFTEPTDGFLCSLKPAARSGIQFTDIKIRDMSLGSNKVLIHASTGKLHAGESCVSPDPDCPERGRTLRYRLENVLDMEKIGSSLTFTLNKGTEPVEDFSMIEKYYFRNTEGKYELIKEYEFKFGFIIPGSSNTHEVIYDPPQVSDEKKEEILKRPYEVYCDSFYFGGGKLILHNKARYNYA